MRTINITYEDKEFKKLEKAKQECCEARKQKLSWEDYIMIKCLGKII